jgi:NAD(P)-dependent dehydrogenase (short-subunit alcohol dehydrogenase family)
MQRFKDKVVIVSGAGSGIGQAAAIRLASEGGTVACFDVNQAGLDETINTINSEGGTAKAWLCDVSNQDAVNNAIQEVVDQYSQLNALCNIAGILRFDHTTDLKLDDWNTIINVNLTGTFLMCQAAIPHLLKTRGSIVNMASTAALGAHAWTAAYSASKGGVFSLT